MIPFPPMRILLRFRAIFEKKDFRQHCQPQWKDDKHGKYCSKKDKANN
jgi:hypothetical protein